MFPAHCSSRVRAKDREKILLQILPVGQTVEEVVLTSRKELGSIRKGAKAHLAWQLTGLRGTN
jgi:hypothetical protein